MNAPKISIIIPCYNMELFLEECLQSVLSQTLSEIEVVCVNDGSTDSTLQILQQYRQKDSRVIVIEQENQGVAASRNTAMRRATGEYIAFMDPDDFYPNDHTLELLYTKASGNNAWICGGSMSTFYQTTKTISVEYSDDLAKNTLHHEGFVDYRDYQYDFSYHRFLYNRAMLMEHDIFFPPYVRSQDPPFFVRAMITAGSFYAIPDVVYRYRYGFQTPPTLWPIQKVCDLMRSRLDNLTISAQHNLSELHALTARRFESKQTRTVVVQALRAGNQEVFSLLKQLNAAVSPALLQETGVQLDEHGGYLLRGYENWLTAASLEEGNAKMIPVVMASDENYVVPMSVTIGSLLHNAEPETRYDIYILVPDEFSAVSKLLLQQFEERYPGCRINFFVMKEAFNDAPLLVKHITKVTYYRLLIPSLLPQYDKCLYLDTDLVANADLTELYRTDISDCYLAGVRAVGYMYNSQSVARHTERLGVPSVENYINAGVLVMNLDKIRQDGLEDRFVELSKQTLTSQDQDVLNLACYNNIKILPPRFNLMSKYIDGVNGHYCFNRYAINGYSDDEKETALKKPVIVHFADKKKPWSDFESALSEYWFKYAPYSTFYISPFYLPIQQKAQMLEQERAALKKAAAKDAKTIARLKRQLALVKKSASFRVGRIITYVPRKALGVLRCCKDHGVGYTFKRTVARIFGKTR